MSSSTETDRSTTSVLRTLFAGPATLATFVFLVVPLAVGSVDGRLMTPLAYPGYLIMMVGSSLGSYLFPNFALWVFWAPFVAGCYAISVGVGFVYRTVR